jgi:outer membrane protein assembly factor BamB
MRPLRPILALAALAALSACGDREELLPGPREDVRGELGLAQAAPAALAPVAIALPVPRRTAAWPMRGGAADNDPGHAALGAAPAPLWSVQIGEGNARRRTITADPVSDGARLFAMDSLQRVVALDRAGRLLWSRDLTPPSDRPGEASGGGLAVVGGTLYATTGFGELHALDAASGAPRWVQRLDAPLASPKVGGGLVHVVARDGRAWAIEASTGRLRWEIPAAPAAIVSAHAPGPALAGRQVVLPFGSGEVVSALAGTGIETWRAAIFGGRLGTALAAVDDMLGDPVIADGRVYVSSLSGRTIALDPATGERLWTARDGAVSPPVAVGGALFLASDRNQLVRLDAATGAPVWRRDLPFYLADRTERRDAVHALHGPVLAGGRLWVASSDGWLRGFSPASGALAAALPVPGGAASRPIVVDGAIYVMGADGSLNAYR